MSFEDDIKVILLFGDFNLIRTQHIPLTKIPYENSSAKCNFNENIIKITSRTVSKWFY
jgi:hypothetical protein